MALAEFEQAKANQREVAVDQALSRMLTDPFAWDDTVSNRLFVLWKTAGGQHHVDAITKKYLLKGKYLKGQLAGDDLPARADEFQ